MQQNVRLQMAIGCLLLVALVTSCERKDERLLLSEYAREDAHDRHVDWAEQAARVRKISDHVSQIVDQVPQLRSDEKKRVVLLLVELARVEPRTEYARLFGQLLADSDWRVVGAVAGELGDLPSQFSAPILLNYLESSDAEWTPQRLVAMRSLGVAITRGATDVERRRVLDFLSAVVNSTDDSQAAVMAVNAMNIADLIQADECHDFLRSIAERFPGVENDEAFLRVRDWCGSH